MRFPAFRAVCLAAAAAGLFLLNIVFICRPFRKRTPKHKEYGKCDETEVLLGADVEHQRADADCEDPHARMEATYPADLRLSLQALGDGVIVPGPQQLQGASDAADSCGALVTPDEVLIQLQDDTATAIHATAAAPSTACMFAVNGRASAPDAAPEPASTGSMASSDASILQPTASCSTAGDSESKAFLQGLLDTGFGPPKFTIPKAPLNTPATILQSPQHDGHMSLEQLLSTSLGPPKFVVPNPDPPPMLAHSPTPSPLRASDATSSHTIASNPVLDSSSPTIGHSSSSSFSDKIIYNPPAAPDTSRHPEGETPQSSQEQRQAHEQQQHYAHKFDIRDTTNPSESNACSAASLEPMLLASRPIASSSTSHSSHTIASSASAAVYQQLNSKIPRASSKRASLLPVVAELGTPHLRLELISGPDSGKVQTLTDADTNYRIGRLPQCEFQIMDQEVSGKHAELCWRSNERTWELTDAGSLNGTVLNGQTISTEYKHKGPSHPLKDGDRVEFGSVTTARVSLISPAEDTSTHMDGNDGDGGAAKRHHAGRPIQSLSVPGESAHPSSRLDSNPGRLTFAFGSSSRHPLLPPPPPPLASVHIPHIRAHMAVQQMVGVEHAHLGQVCEDVAHWEECFSPFHSTALLCLFDGHQGVRAAAAAKIILPAALRAAASLSLPPPLQPSSDTHSGIPSVTGDRAVSSPDASAVHGPSPESAAISAPVSPLASAADSLAQSATPESSPEAGPDCTAGITHPTSRADSTAGSASVTAAADLAAQIHHPLLQPPPLLGWRSSEAQKSLLTAAFLEADAQMGMDEGCTASAVIVQADSDGSWVVQSANVGDSSAILVDVSSHQWVKLTGDHRISTSASERERLEKRGHIVRSRLYGLNISRMLGDRCLKEENLGFLAEPHVSTAATVPAGHVAYLILASDGLWDVVTEAAAAGQVLRAADAAAAAASCSTSSALAPSGKSSQQLGGQVQTGGCLPQQQQQQRQQMPSVEELASALLQQALSLRSKDDITIMVMRLGGEQQLVQPLLPIQ